MQKGKFIVLYGINNIGKSTQAKMLVERLGREGKWAEYLKYPVYDLEPTGSRIDGILRKGAEPDLVEEDLQQLYAQNRRDYESTLTEILDAGTWVVAEDYRGTGIAWGWTKGAKLATLEEMNADLLSEDVVVLMDGERFLEAREENHIHEREDDLVVRCRQKHIELGRMYGWSVVDATGTKEEVHERIWEIVKKITNNKLQTNSK